MTGFLVLAGAAALIAIVILAVCLVDLRKVRRQLGEARLELEEARRRIEELAMRDEITGAFNRRYLMETLEKERSRVARGGTTFSVCLFDIDNFKAINDARGHAAGDGVLKRFAELLPAELRSIDVFGRFAGGQFLLVLPGADGDGATICAERVRKRLEANAFAELGGRRATVTVGVATQKGEEPSAALLARAEDALGRGKAAGRNRVMAIG